ncbi:MAG: MBL fold metallo-hydrolase [Candidatus Nanopelagicales bacterium]|nr:MBL fold metallo-hydrolase [Candidatus Nanopelagicales bacterium]
MSVDGPGDVRELPALIISKLAVGPYDNNAYLLRCRDTGEQALIDAAAQTERLLALVGDSLQTVVTTHEHQDHWGSLADIVAATGATTMAHPIDAPGIPVATDVMLEEGSHLQVGLVRLRVIHLVGHTDGSIAFVYDDPEGTPHLFTGDCLFPGGVGNTWGDTARFRSLIDGVEEKLFNALPDETWVYPGHGSDTTLGAERPHLREWRERQW